MTYEATAPTLSDIYPELSGFSAKDFKKKNQLKVNISVNTRSRYALLLILGIGSILLIGFVLSYLYRQPNAHHHHHHHHHHSQQVAVDESNQKVKNSSLDLVTSQNETPNLTDQNLTVSYEIEDPILLENELRLKFIHKMTLNAWEAHFGTANELDTNTDGGALLGSMSTLWVLGLKDQFKRSKEWIRENLDLTQMDGFIYVSSLVSDYIGGLLSCYALTGDPMFLDRAFQAGRAIKPAYKTQSGLAYNIYNPALQKVDYPESDRISTASIGKQLLEYACLENMARVTNLYWIQPRILSINSYLQEAESPLKGLLMDSVNVCTGKASHSSRPHYRKGDYTEATQLLVNLIKLSIESGYKQVQNMTQTSGWYKNALNSVAEDLKNPNYKVHATSCYIGPILYLRWRVMVNQTISGFTKDVPFSTDPRSNESEKQEFVESNNKTFTKNQIEKHSNLALELIKSCDHNSMHRMVKSELAESYFLLWRLTHDQKYRDYAWAMAQEIDQHYGRTSHFLSATLKFLYLTFTDDSVLPLGEWVFNSAGHPLPICGTNGAYPEENCAKIQ